MKKYCILGIQCIYRVGNLVTNLLCVDLFLGYWAFDFAFLVAEFRTTTPESVNYSSNIVCRGL